jgi:hypothetical protein
MTDGFEPWQAAAFGKASIGVQLARRIERRIGEFAVKVALKITT